jgi:hypothetical protein
MFWATDIGTFSVINIETISNLVQNDKLTRRFFRDSDVLAETIATAD